jgi:membrane-associated phospholipid phosphatase
MKPGGLWRCVIAEWKIKFFLGGAVTLAFWAGYFLLERFPQAPVTQMPELAIDRMIPFWPGAAFIYVSQFATMPLIIWLMTSRRQLFVCCRGLTLLIGVGFACFYFWPTSVARPEMGPGGNFFYDLVVNSDLPRNACPSLHAAFGVFIAGCAWEMFRSWKNGGWLIGAMWLWTAAVLVSTLLTKQHVFLDLAAGVVLGATSWWVKGSHAAPADDNGACRTPAGTRSSAVLDNPHIGVTVGQDENRARQMAQGKASV